MSGLVFLEDRLDSFFSTIPRWLSEGNLGIANVPSVIFECVSPVPGGSDEAESKTEGGKEEIVVRTPARRPAPE